MGDMAKENGHMIGRLTFGEVILGIEDGNWVKHLLGYSCITKNGEVRLLMNKKVFVIVNCDNLGKLVKIEQKFTLVDIVKSVLSTSLAQYKKQEPDFKSGRLKFS